METRELEYKWYKCEPGNMPEDFPEMIKPNEDWRTKSFVVMHESGFMISEFRYCQPYSRNPSQFYWGARYDFINIPGQVKYWMPVPPIPEDVK